MKTKSPLELQGAFCQAERISCEGTFHGQIAPFGYNEGMDLQTEVSPERRLLEQFLTALSHDLRGPLGIARMSAEILSDEHIADADRRRFGAMISENMDRADMLIRDLQNAVRERDTFENGDLESLLKSAIQSLPSGRAIVKRGH